MVNGFYCTYLQLVVGIVDVAGAVDICEKWEEVKAWQLKYSEFEELELPAPVVLLPAPPGELRSRSCV